MFEEKYNNNPIYIQLKDIILKRIEDGFYKNRKLIPSEMDMTKEFNVSRVTVRKALGILEEDGYIQRKKGFGTVVSYNGNDHFKFTLLKSFTSEMKESGKPVVTLSAVLKNIKADNELARLFDCRVGDDIYYMIRVRGDNSSPIVISYTYLKLPIDLPNNPSLLYGSLYAYLMSKGIVFSKMKEVISATLPSKEIIEKLEIDKNDPVLKRERYAIDDNGVLREYTINFYNSDNYKYNIDISNN